MYSQGGQLLYVKATNTSTATKYVYLHNHVLAEVNGAAVTYDHTDGLGSPVAQTNASGLLLNRTRYEPYGAVASGNAGTIGFTGHVNDNDTGLVYMQQRYYDPAAGRFLSIDPVTTDADTGSSFNRCVYANNSPYGYVDPEGRDPENTVVVIPGQREPPPAPLPVPPAASPRVARPRIDVARRFNDGPIQSVHPECIIPGFRLLCSAAEVGTVVAPIMSVRGAGRPQIDKQKNGRPANNSSQNKQVDEAARDEKLTAMERNELGRAVEEESRGFGRNLDYHDLRELARDIKNGNR